MTEEIETNHKHRVLAERLLTTGFSRPVGLQSNTKQHVIVVADDSSSMAGEKGRQRDEAFGALRDEFVKPVNKDGFYLSAVAFGSSAKIVLRPTLATAVGPVSIGGMGGMTNIKAALQETQTLLTQSVGSGEMRFLRPVVMLLTDGCNNEGGDPRSLASEIRKHADIVGIAFGSDADESFLREIATSPQHVTRATNGAELRQFFAAVGQTMSIARSRGMSATSMLSGLASRRR